MDKFLRSQREIHGPHRGEPGALSDAVDEAGSGRTVLDGGGIGLGVRPLLDKPPHAAVALKILDEEAPNSACWSSSMAAATSVLGRAALPMAIDSTVLRMLMLHLA